LGLSSRFNDKVITEKSSNNENTKTIDIDGECTKSIVNDNYKEGEWSKYGIKLIGIIKEVAPVKGAETDKELGVASFQRNYFLNNDVYIDDSLSFYNALGSKLLLNQGLHSWNPFTLYADYKNMKRRLKEKGLKGNYAGEGLTKGGNILMIFYYLFLNIHL
jgi:hypothetical protein